MTIDDVRQHHTAEQPADEDLQVLDERTGGTLQLAIADGAVRAVDLGEIAAAIGEAIKLYDPALRNTATCRRSITFLDGTKGSLAYRGYPIEELAAQSDFLEPHTCWHMAKLPDAKAYGQWTEGIFIFRQSDINDDLVPLANAFPRGTHPMSVLLGLVAALGAGNPEAAEVNDADLRLRQITIIIAKLPALAALCCGYHLPSLRRPTDGRGYATSVLGRLLFGSRDGTYEPNSRLICALDTLFILHADHEQNCSTNAMRTVGSSKADPHDCVAGGIATVFGPLHGGANTAVTRMLHTMGAPHRVAECVGAVKQGRARLTGDRVHRSFDPRAQIINQQVMKSSRQQKPIPSWTARSNSRGWPWKMITSSPGSCTPMSTSTLALSLRP